MRLTEKISGPPTISPDGKLIACTYREEALSRQKLALIPFEGNVPVRLVELQDMPARLIYRWMNDGRAVAYIRTQARRTSGGSRLMVAAPRS